MKRKAFTLVEMAIVVLVIGLVVGVTIKGKSLIERSKLRAEIRKIEKVQAAVAAFFAQNGKLPPINDDNLTFNRAVLLSGDYGTLSDFTINIKPLSQVTDYGWGLFSCYADAVNGGFVNSTNETRKLGSVCVSPVSADAKVALGGYLACNIESMYDDKHYLFGSARFFADQGTPPANIPSHKEDYERCEDYATPLYYGIRIW